MGSLTGIRQSSSQGRVTTGIYEDSSQAEFARWCLRRGGAIPQRGRTLEFASRPGAQGQQGTKKRRSEERRPSRITTGANQIRPES